MCEQSLVIGKGKGKDERRRLGLAAVSEKCRQSTFMRSHWSKSENLIALWKYPFSYLYPSIYGYISIFLFMLQMGDIYGDMLERDLRKLRLSRYIQL